jgi:ribose transport system ATP-binding protein
MSSVGVTPDVSTGSDTAERALVRIENVSMTFPGQRALSEVSFEIGRGVIHALVGENGSGKSTLIKVLSGYHRPDDGSTIVVSEGELGFGVPAMSYAKGLRFVHQDLGLVASLDALDNWGIYSGFAQRRSGRIDWKAQEKSARTALAQLGVEIDPRRPVGELRPVDRTSIAIARALDQAHGEIALLVLDEPTAALPPSEVEALFTLLRKVVQSGVSILYVSHRLDEIIDLASRVTVLRNGRCLGTWPTAGLDAHALAELIVGAEHLSRETLVARAPGRLAADAADPRFEVRSLKVGDGAEIEFDVRCGEVLGFAGVTGSGREILAETLGGARRATFSIRMPDGQIAKGALTPSEAADNGIALVLSNTHPASAMPTMTLRENITLPAVRDCARRGRIVRSAERRVVERWLEVLDIRPRDPDRLYGLLSGGNRQKVLLAKSLNLSPKMLVLDEPTGGVDVGARANVHSIIRQQAAAGLACVICSSDHHELIDICDRVLVLGGGTIRSELAGSELTEDHLLAACADAAALSN